ncbi:MAG: fatty acid desaturase [Acidiferrobacterales bacterium]
MIRLEEQRPREPDQNHGQGFEWPTFVVAASIYAGFAVLTWHYHALPWWLVLACGGYLVAWHGSLQHEAVHGHPTRWSWVNELIVFPSLWLWMPYRLYRAMHLAHHAVESLTDPFEDPESFYLAPQAWARKGPVSRAFYWAHNTSWGRLLLGPFYVSWRLLAGQTRRLFQGDTTHLSAWLLHGVGCTLVLVWVLGVCRIPVIEYLGLFVYPGIALTLLRSFLEHQALEETDHRTVIVEAGPLMSLLYLNNNLHASHHNEPHLPWYQLPKRYREQRADVLARNGSYRYRGYGEVIARYLFRPKEPAVYPLLDHYRATTTLANERLA